MNEPDIRPTDVMRVRTVRGREMFQIVRGDEVIIERPWFGAHDFASVMRRARGEAERLLHEEKIEGRVSYADWQRIIAEEK